MDSTLATMESILETLEMFNLYHVSPAQSQNPDEYVTEACFPIE